MVGDTLKRCIAPQSNIIYTKQGYGGGGGGSLKMLSAQSTFKILSDQKLYNEIFRKLLFENTVSLCNSNEIDFKILSVFLNYTKTLPVRREVLSFFIKLLSVHLPYAVSSNISNFVITNLT